MMIPGFALGFAATIGVSLVTEPPPGVDEEFDSVWSAVGRQRTAARGVEGFYR